MIPIITSPDKSDVNLILNIFDECSSDMKSRGIEQWDNVYPNIEVIQEDVDNQSIFIAKLKGDLVGVVSFDNKELEEYRKINWTYYEGNIAVIHRLAVKPQYQGLGIAKKLMQFVHESCEMQQYQSIRLDVYSGNDSAIKFYLKLGYVYCGEVWFPRRRLPFYCMEKKIG